MKNLIEMLPKIIGVLEHTNKGVGIELGLPKSPAAARNAGIYQYEEDYFFHSVTDNGRTTVQVNLLSSFVITDPRNRAVASGNMFV